MIDVGDTITRDGEAFRLVGISEGEWVAEPLDDFGPPVRLTARDLAAFGVEASDPSADGDPVASETQGWRALSEAARVNSRRRVPRPPTVEEIFSEAESAGEQDGPSTGRRDGLTGKQAAALGHRTD